MPTQRELIDGATGQHFSSLELLVGQAISGGGGGSVTSVFGRTGAVVAQPGDYLASQVSNDSGVSGSGVSGALDTLDSGLTALSGSLASLAAQVAALDSSDIANVSGVGGATVTDALNTLAKTSAPVTSVFGRTGAVVAAKGDYAASQVTNDSGVGGTGVSGALDTLDAAISALVTGVSSVFGRTGAVTAKSGDYAASQVTNDSAVTGTAVSDALNALSCIMLFGGASVVASTTVRWLIAGTVVANVIASTTLDLRGEYPSPSTVNRTLRNLRVFLSGTYTADQTVTVYINGIASSITCTIAAGNTSGTDLVHTEVLAPGDRVSMRVVSTGSDATARIINAVVGVL